MSSIPTIGKDLVTYLSSPAPAFEDAYLVMRQKEGRLYTDEALRRLPEVEKGHPLYEEWQMRAYSSKLIVKLMQDLPAQAKVLEVGCGNGWLSACMAKQTHLNVTGLDVNQVELEQAASVFAHVQDLRFCYGNLFENIFPQGQFDFILLAAAAQYFTSLQALIERLFYFLSAHGKIIIADTHFYESSELESAKERTWMYYTSIGYPEMAAYYFHHLKQDLAPYRPEWLYQPTQWRNWLRKKLFGKAVSPFPIVRISR